MGNALQSTMAAVNAGFIGKNPLEGKLAAIDKGIKGVQDWKANIDKQRLELKQNTAKQIREAELKAYENMPSDETAQAKVLEGLAKYKDQMLMNERLVRNGSVPPEENLIFFENGKQSFDIFAQNVANYDKELELTRKRAEGYRDEEGNLVKPTSGVLEAAQQQIQGALANLNGMDINFTEKGMGNIQFYEMELAEDGVTMTPKLDEKGERIPTKGAEMSVLALKHPANGRSERVYLIDEVNAFSGSSVATNYEIMVTDGLMVGNVVNDARNNSEFGTNINNQVAAMTSTITQAASILSEDNGIGVKYVPFNQYESDAYWEQLGDSKDATITIDILNENMEKDQVTVPKYVKVAPTSNNSITAHFPKDQDHMKAAQGYTRKSLVDGLQRKITKGTKRTEFDQSTPSKATARSQKDEGARTIAALNNLRGAKTSQDMELALQELQGLSGLAYSGIEETKETVSVPDGKGGFTEEEIVTAVNLDFGGQIIPVEFGEVVTDSEGRKTFKQTDPEDFVKSSYKYFNRGGVSADIGFEEFIKRGNTLFEDVSQPGTGSRVKQYKQTKNVTLAGEYNLGGSKTSLDTQLSNAFNNADEERWPGGQDMNTLVGGVESAIGSAYDAMGLTLPNGFNVSSSGEDLIISAIDSEGITVKETLKGIGDAGNQGGSILKGGVQTFLNKMNQ
ncbi:MAG: hypothetical protein ACXABD_10640 [Candidatus Thorarchaeota archaeon]|jgi:hypothetical protein